MANWVYIKKIQSTEDASMQKIRIPLRRRGSASLCIPLPTKFALEQGLTSDDYVIMTVEDDGNIRLEPKKIAELEKMAQCA
jgi:hypothetical protein